MQCVYELNGLRVIDLTKCIDPSTETRRCNLDRFNTGGAIPDFHTNVDIMTHLGTHCECPYHHFEDGASVADLPLTSFLGRGLYYEFKGLAPLSHIGANDLEKALGDRVKPGDVVIIDSIYKLTPFTPETNGPNDKRLLVNGETAQWFVDHEVKCVGFGDGVSIENCNEDVKPFHDICMAKNITFLEVVKNLEHLRQNTFFVSFAPMFIKGLDSCPVRMYAIEGLKEFC